MPEYDPKIDYYEILQVHPRASTAVIKAAYRVILRELRAHPDLGGREDFAKVLNEAHRVLTDPQLRLAYDGARLLFDRKPRPQPEVEQILDCPRCRRPNALPLGTDLRSARCTSCGALLHFGPTAPPPEPHENLFHLSPADYRMLCQQGHLDRRLEQIEGGDTLRCRFCGNEWKARKAGRPLATCPLCARGEWHHFRIHKCRACGYEWRSTRLSNWPYRDHPHCPNCTQRRWSNYCESHPLRWFLSLLPWTGAYG